MAITYVGAGNYSSSTIAPSPTLPAGWQEGDIFVLFRESMNGGANFSADWNEVSGSPSFANGDTNSVDTALGVFWRRATSSETAPTMNDTGNHSSAIILAFRGCVASGDPFDAVAAAQQTTVTTSGTAASITTTVADTLILIAATHSDNGVTTPQFNSATNANLTNITERSDNSTDDNNGGGLAIWTAEKATAGSTGTTTITCARSTTMAFFTLALKPALTGTDYQEDFSDTVTLDDTATPVHGTGHLSSASDVVALSDTVTTDTFFAPFTLTTTTTVTLGTEI